MIINLQQLHEFSILTNFSSFSVSGGKIPLTENEMWYNYLVEKNPVKKFFEAMGPY